LNLQNRPVFGTKKSFMKKLFLFGAALVLTGVVQAALPASDLIARIHFVGADKISADTNSAAFTNEFCSAEAQALKAQTLDKLAHAPAAWLKGKIAAGAGDGAAQLRPLLDDLLKAEWFLDARSAADGSPEFALAIRLDNNRAQLWQNNLAALLESWTKISSQKIAGGWQLTKHQPPDSIRFVHAGGWVVFSCEQAGFALGDGVVAKIPASAAKSYWLSVDADWPRLVKLFPLLTPVDLPEVKLQVIGRDGNLRTDGKIISAQPFAMTLDKWRMPANTIHQPFVSFTAARGIAPWLQKQSWAQPFLISPVPNQVFFWAMAGVPFQTFGAVPVPEAGAALVQLHDKIAASPTNAQPDLFMPLTMDMANREITWKGMPFAAPSVRAVHEASGDFLLGGLFPNSPKSEPLPPELSARIAPANLVFYHWEITSERLKMLLQPAQLTLMMTRHKQFDAGSVAGKWLNHISPTLGPSTMEVTQTAPNELTLIRKAPGGLTGIELFALANWLEAANFPGCDLRLPPPHPMRKPHPPVKVLSIPAPAAPK
jgi:hypothetical protein